MVVDEQSRDFRQRGGDAGLVLLLEREQAGDLPGPLPGRDDIVIIIDVNEADFLGHHVSYDGRSRTCSFKTTTVASSRPRAKSRYRMPAIRLGSLASRPGYCVRSQCVPMPSL